jgi:hypothetical protein
MTEEYGYPETCVYVYVYQRRLIEKSENVLYFPKTELSPNNQILPSVHALVCQGNRRAVTFWLYHNGNFLSIQ